MARTGGASQPAGRAGADSGGAVDVVLGISMESTAVRMVLLEGENADGVTVEEDTVRIAAVETATRNAPGHVISAILGTRQGAAEGGYRLASTGVAYTNPVEATALREALANNGIRDVTLVSAFLAAAALTQTVGQAIGYRHTAMLLVDPNFATIAVIDSEDGSITGMRRQRRALSLADTTVQLAAMVADSDASELPVEGVFLVGQGVDTARLKAALEVVTPLAVSAPEEPQAALARGAALASANAPLLVLSTGALAYAQDPGTGEVPPCPLHDYPGLADPPAERPVAYSDMPEPSAEAETTLLTGIGRRGAGPTRYRRRPVLLTGSVLAVIFTCAAVALEIALAINIRTTVALQPNPEQNIIVPTRQAPAPHGQLAPVTHLIPRVSAPTVAIPDLPKPAVAGPAAPPPPVPVAAPVPVPVLMPVPAAAPLPPVPNIAPLLAPHPVSVAPLQLPKPPAVQLPTPPALQLPKPPAVQLPEPPALQLPKPPALQLPAPQPLQLPAPALPKAPVLAAPSLPVFRPPAPIMPQLPALPRFPFAFPRLGL